MPKQIVIAEQHRTAAVFSEDQIQELVVATGSHQVGDIYLGIVENVLPGIDAAFVNIGDSERNGFIHVSDLGPLRLKRSAGAITELLAPQQKVLVQVMKEPTGNKGPRLTGNVSLPGRYLVLMPFGKGVNLSRRIRNENERNRLRALAILLKPAGMGLLVRTEAEGMGEDAIIEDLEALQRQWESIQQEAMTTRPPSLLNRDDDFIQRVLRDMHSSDVNRIVVDSHTGLKRVRHYLTNWNGGKIPPGVLIDHHRDRIPILEYFRVNAAIREALKPRVDLPSGGYIIIEPTEALTVIDVNSGSFTRSATARETVLWTNSEAAVEIARQLRLRNVAGVIIVDFIDMDSRRDQLQVLEQFNKALKMDKARPQIAQLSELGLVELTRKRQGQNIYELFGRNCPTCGGLGHLVHLPGESVYPTTPELPESSRDYPVAELPVSLRESWDGASDDADLNPSADLQELDLLHHPSYQERGSANRRRRRRRGEPIPRTSSVRPTEADRDRDRDRESESVSPSVVMEVVPALELSPEPRPERVERERSRPSSRRDKPSPEPPQVVTVEMTPEEQDLYAFMGISPLVLATETVKDVKSVMIQVTLPGEKSRVSTPDVDLSGFDEADSADDHALEKAAPATDVSLVEPKQESPRNGVNRPSTVESKRGAMKPEPASAEPEPEPSAAEAIAPLPSPTSKTVMPVPTASNGSSSSTSRRRRRRSSASTD
jgi:ribonuclease E